MIDLQQKRAERERREQGPDSPTDAALNENFDRLQALAEEAWSWRDPESLQALHEQLLRCATDVEREWGEPVFLSAITGP